MIQILCHVTWIIYAYFWTVCYAKPSYFDVVFIYLTYFYRSDCGQINLQDDALFLNGTFVGDVLPTANETSAEVLYHFLKTILEYAELPSKTSVASRTDLYLALFFVSDVAWIVTTILLLVGAFSKTNKRISMMIYYGPWMFVSAYVIFLDIVSSVHFGLDMVYIQSYSSWLNFIGVSNYKDFEVFNNKAGSSFIPAIPSSIFITLTSRVFFVWLTNIVCFSIVLFLAIPSLNYRARSNAWKSRTQKLNTRRTLRFGGGGEDLDPNSTDARIRNWQQFYGAIDANSTMNSSGPDSSNSVEGISTANVINAREEVTNDHVQRRGNEHGIRIQAAVTKNIKLQLLRSQLPWSYISPESNKRYPKSIRHINVNVIESTRL
ncbi:hypothetical protein GWI33_019062 [Rhynchophorus ferrugineus]|uniref:Uncharacterized protein n=1 Tax=Rhynchophorus ferrugineus TaxID=354439 RepID=A0A834M7D6_RHYFE|nr:hypothetical protein GWI33_019062 [Rhynchophorus ferrugineus]